MKSALPTIVSSAKAIPISARSPRAATTECVALATARIARINAAYEQLAKKRNAARSDPTAGDRPLLAENHGARPEPARIDMLVLHYTGMTPASAALERLRHTSAARVSAHYPR